MSYLCYNWNCKIMLQVLVTNEEILSQSVTAFIVPEDPGALIKIVVGILYLELWEGTGNFDAKLCDALSPLKVEFYRAFASPRGFVGNMFAGGLCSVEKVTTQIQEEQIVHLVRMLSPSLWH